MSIRPEPMKHPARFGGAEWTRLVLVKLCSAPPNRAGGSWANDAINMSPLRGETRVLVLMSNVKLQTISFSTVSSVGGIRTAE